MPQPGTIFSSMPPRPGDQTRRLQELEATVRMQGSAPAGQAMQVGAGGILVNDGGSITIQAPGSLNVAGGALNSGGSITAQTDITAGTTMHAGGGGFVVDASGNVTAASVSTGAVSASSVTTTGQVNSAAALKSAGTYGYAVASSYKAVWIDGATYQLGYTASSQIVKTSLVQMTATDAERLLNIKPYWGRYVWDAPTEPARVFFLAEDVQAAGFGPDVAPVVGADGPLTILDTDGKPVLDDTGQPCVVPVGSAYTINYANMVVPLVAAYHQAVATIQTMQAQITKLQAQVAQLATAANVTFTGAAA